MKVKNSAHRPGPLKQQNKTHKTGRHRSKSQIDREKKGKSSIQGITKKNKKQLSRAARKHRAHQLRTLKQEETLNKKRGLGEPHSPPFLALIISLCEEQSAKSTLNILLACGDESSNTTYCDRGIVFMNVARFKQRFSFVCPDTSNIYEVLDYLKVADVVLFVWPADGELDPQTSVLLSGLKAQGLPTCLNVGQGLSLLNGKRKEMSRRNLVKNLEKWSLEPKIFQLDSPSDALNVIRHIGSCLKKPLNLQKYRPHMLAESLEFDESHIDSDIRTIKLYGYLKGRALNVNQLIHLSGVGDFQMNKIEILPDPRPLYLHRKEKNADINMNDDALSSFVADPNTRESLSSFIVPDSMLGEQTWPSEDELRDSETASVNQKSGKMKRVPAGTSSYQAAWIVDNSDSCSEDEDEDSEEEIQMDNENILKPKDEEMSQADEENEMDETKSAEGLHIGSIVAMTETDCAEKYDVRFDEEEEKRLLKEFREQRENEQFPDEIDTPVDIPARIRFQRYRGLKSFRTSPWNPKENLPHDYAKIFKFENFRRTKKRLLNEEIDSPVPRGSYVCIHVENVPKSKLELLSPNSPLVLYGMLPHEQKLSVINFVLHKHQSYSWSIKSKETLVFHVGYRRFCAAPIFSQHTNGDKFKYEKFMPVDGAVVASVYAPIAFPPCSVLVFKQDGKGRHRLVATGAVLDVKLGRVVKRIILSGHPFKIHKRGAVIRYMFFNKENIDWFKPVELRTKLGRHGHIKDALGIDATTEESEIISPENNRTIQAMIRKLEYKKKVFECFQDCAFKVEQDFNRTEEGQRYLASTKQMVHFAQRFEKQLFERYCKSLKKSAICLRKCPPHKLRNLYIQGVLDNEFCKYYVLEDQVLLDLANRAAISVCHGTDEIWQCGHLRKSIEEMEENRKKGVQPTEMYKKNSEAQTGENFAETGKTHGDDFELACNYTACFNQCAREKIDVSEEGRWKYKKLMDLRFLTGLKFVRLAFAAMNLTLNLAQNCLDLEHSLANKDLDQFLALSTSSADMLTLERVKDVWYHPTTPAPEYDYDDGFIARVWR